MDIKLLGRPKPLSKVRHGPWVGRAKERCWLTWRSTPVMWSR